MSNGGGTPKQWFSMGGGGGGGVGSLTSWTATPGPGVYVTNVRPPGKRYIFNETTMLFEDTQLGQVSRVTRFELRYSQSDMAERWRFHLVSSSHSGEMICEVMPWAIEAYLKPGTPGPRTAEQIFVDKAGTITGARSTTPTSQEDSDMAQRHDFTFEYTGTEIAKAIDTKIKDLRDKITAANKHDLDGLIEANLITADKKAAVESTITGHQDRIKKWEAEKRPYTKAGAKKFALDAEDVAHFGL